ncbi:MAG: right-handed parallel beta-helix repeat-containing protein [Anaerolineae bacterium]
MWRGFRWFMVWSALLGLLLAAGVPAGAAGATLEVSQPTYATSNGDYDRSPSITFDGSDYWLFWTKGDGGGVRGQGSPPYDPDGDTYVVYYKKATTIAGLASAAETKLALSETSRPANFTQRVVSATYFDGKVYAFVSSGQDGTDRGLYYYEYSGGSWSGPITLIADATARGGHVNVTSDGSRVYLVWEATADASSDCYTWDGTTLSAKVDVSSDNEPKITRMGGTLYVVGIEDGTGDLEVHSAAAAASPSFSSHSTAIAGAGYYDPCIFSDGTDLYVVTAPYDSGNDRQYLVQARYSGGSWAAAKKVSHGGYAGAYWWEYWPCGYYDGSDLWLFFTTETSSPTYSDGEIAFVEMDWDLTRDHYFYLRNAVEGASAGDTIHLAAGTYAGGIQLDANGITLRGEEGAVIGPGSPAFTVTADDVVLENLVVDGWTGSANSTDPGILVQGGADNLIVQNCEILRWADGLEVGGGVKSLKVVGNWFHSNTDAGLQLDSGVTVTGNYVIEGNLFKENGGNGIQNDGSTNPLLAEYNSWGHLSGPASGDGVSAQVDADPFTFAEVFLDVDPPTEAVQRNVDESTDFDVALKVDAAKLYGLTFKFTYDTTKLTLDSTTFGAGFAGRCYVVGTPPAGTIRYRCNLQHPDAEYDADGGVVATFHFTAEDNGGLTGNGPWTATFDLSHALTGTSAGAIGGVRVFVNNAGFGSPSASERDITDANDGQIDIRGIGQFTGYVNLQGRTDDSGAGVRVYDQQARAGSTELANATSNSEGAYTTSYVGSHLLTVGTTYWLQVDAWLYLPTTAASATDWAHSHALDTRPKTTLNTPTLRGGDATDDDTVDITDAACIGRDFGGSPGVCSTTGTSDVTGDGLVDILDLVLVASDM